MASEVTMPKLGLTMEEGTVVKWVKDKGDKINKGDIVVEIESDKITNEVEAESEGILAVKKFAEGEVAEVGEVLGLIAENESEISELEQQDETKISGGSEVETEKTAEVTSVDNEVSVEQRGNGELEKPASPKAKKAAEELDVNLEDVEIIKGERITSEDVKIFAQTEQKAQEEKAIKITPVAEKMLDTHGLSREDVKQVASGSRISSDDVEEFLKTRDEVSVEPSSADRVEQVEMSQMRRTIAENMSKSWEAPHVYLRSEINVEKLFAVLESFRDDDIDISLNDIISLVTVRTLMEHPDLNATYQDGQINRHKDVNLGIAVAVDSGLIVPVVPRADKMTLKKLAQNVHDKIERTRSGEIEPEEYQGGTFTLSNLGMYGIDEFTAVLNPPQVGILAVGKVQNHVIKEDDEIKNERRINFTLGIDHRAIDGAQGARFLQTFEEFVQNPYNML